MKPILKKYHGAPLNKTGCFLLVLVYANPKMRQVFTRLRKLNMESVSLALLSICPWKIIRALELYQWLRDLGFCEFKKNNNNNDDISLTLIDHVYFHVWCFYNCSVLFVFFWLWLYDCPLPICSTWKSLFVSQNETIVIKWSLTSCTLLM